MRLLLGLAATFATVWLYLLFSVWLGPAQQGQGRPAAIEYPRRFRARAPAPAGGSEEPPPLAEIERNLTLYLRTLHAAFLGLQGARAVPVDIWEAYLSVTKSTVMAWDDGNRHRLPRPREDGSIFVSLGSYRGQFRC
jgi:hypothetical protein